MGAEPDFSLPPPEPEISGTDNRNWKADMMSALGESVSFGRFLTEPLEWGKRSAFAHNRYLEEAAVQARPGSVAQKKAFFEAHYARKKRKSEDQDAASDDVAGGDGSLEAAEDGAAAAASWSFSAAESSCMADEPPAPEEEVCCGWEDGVVDCGGSSASDKPVHAPEELAAITDAVGPSCRMDAPTDEMCHMEGSDQVVGAVLQLQKQDLCTDSLTAVDATLKEISNFNQDITDSVKKRRLQMASLLPKPAKLSSPPTAKKRHSSAKRQLVRHSAKENNAPPSTDSSKLGTTWTPKKRSSLHMSMNFTRCESANASMDSRNHGTTIADRISQLEHATRHAESTKPHDLRLSRKTFSSGLPEIAPRTSQVDEERSSQIMKIKEKLGLTSPTVHQNSGIIKEEERKFNNEPGFKESRQSFCFKARSLPNFYRRNKQPKDPSQQTTQEISLSSKSGHLLSDINRVKAKGASNEKGICCFPIGKM